MTNRPFTVAVELDVVAPDAMTASALVRSMLREVHIAQRAHFAPAEMGDAYRVKGSAPRWAPPFVVVMIMEGSGPWTVDHASVKYDTLSAAWRALDGMLQNAIRQERWPEGASLEIRDKMGGVITSRTRKWFDDFRQEKLGNERKP